MCASWSGYFHLRSTVGCGVVPTCWLMGFQNHCQTRRAFAVEHPQCSGEVSRCLGHPPRCFLPTPINERSSSMSGLTCSGSCAVCFFCCPSIWESITCSCSSRGFTSFSTKLSPEFVLFFFRVVTCGRNSVCAGLSPASVLECARENFWSDIAVAGGVEAMWWRLQCRQGLSACAGMCVLAFLGRGAGEALFRL